MVFSPLHWVKVYLGKLAAPMVAITLIMGLLMLYGLVPAETIAVLASNSTQELTSSHLPEVEAVEYLGTKLMPLSSVIGGLKMLNSGGIKLSPRTM